MYELIELKVRALEQGKTRRSEGTLETPTYLGNPDSPSNDKITQDLALFTLAIDSKLRGCGLVELKVSDISQSGAVQTRAQVFQQSRSPSAT